MAGHDLMPAAEQRTLRRTPAWLAVAVLLMAACQSGGESGSEPPRPTTGAAGDERATDQSPGLPSRPVTVGDGIDDADDTTDETLDDAASDDDARDGTVDDDGDDASEDRPPATAPSSTPSTSDAATDTATTSLTNGPLRAVDGGRYLVDRDGRSVLLTGSHTWTNLLDYGAEPRPPAAFDYDAYLDFLETYHHNFFRLWTWEQAMNFPRTTRDIFIAPNVYARRGTETANDGLPRFDLTTFDDEYFDRLRTRVERARDRGIYVSVMLFNGFSIDDKGSGAGNACVGHPYNAANNVDGIDVDANGDGRCEEAHTLDVPEVTALQEAYVRHVVETVGDLDNVVFEISNESHSRSEAWQQHMIDVIRQAEADRELQHAVGMTVEFPDGDNRELFASSADWISPNTEGGYRDDPPPADGRKVTVLDTDHLWGIGGDGDWVWRAITRGHNVIYMDCYDYAVPECEGTPDDPDRVSALEAMGWARVLTRRIDLGEAAPSRDRCSTGYCLVDDDGPDRSAIVYAPRGGDVTVDLGGPARIEWLDVAAGELGAGAAVAPGPGTSTRVTLPADRPAVLVAHGI